MLGRKTRASVESRARVALEKRWSEPTLWDAVLHYLAAEGYALPEKQLNPDFTSPIEPSIEVQAVLLEIYMNDPKNAELCERLVYLDEGLQEWRYRHIKMVERTIGMKQGTGGSAGSQYLRTTLNSPLFPDLWEPRRQPTARVPTA